ncbi:MAG: 50S ribosome-binding GTPase [Candidatus Diapherotrites archaeon]|nr:50S ribosome-binding GTPase [Candidatus Diapherotrites archaeon]
MGLYDRAMRAIEQADLVFEVVDARFHTLTRNHAIEEKIKAYEKKLALVYNKSDLISKKQQNIIRKEVPPHTPCFFVSCKEHTGITRMRAHIGKTLPKGGKIAMIGYPNTGKSSLINALAGRKAARTSITAGFTRGEQLIKLNQDTYLIDSPGVIPFNQKNEAQLIMVGAKNAFTSKDPEGACLKLLESAWHNKETRKRIEKTYHTRAPENASPEEWLESIARNQNRLRKGGEPDTSVMARKILLDWQKGKLA